MKLGLKLWSTNDFYIDEAIHLYNEKLYDYIELFVVPNSLEYLKLWQKLNIPDNSLITIETRKEQCNNLKEFVNDITFIASNVPK